MNPILLTATGNGNTTGIILLFVLIGIFALYFLWFVRLLKKVSALVPMLTENPDGYMAEMEALIKGFVPSDFKAMLLMNIAVAHMEKNDYQGALQAMGRAKARRLKKDTAAVYFLNLAHIYIQLGENPKAYDIIEANKKAFAKLPMGGNLPALNGFITLFVSMETKSWKQAEELMEYAKKTWPDHIPGVDFTILYDRMEQHREKRK